jgi:predicted DNA-binding transcriptional regulator AlpA
MEEFKMSEEKLLKIEEVAVLIGCSVKTVNNWYMWKKQNPEHEMTQLLPEFVQHGERQTRYWKQSDVYKLIEFQARIPKGRNGILGSVTQKYYKKKQEV